MGTILIALGTFLLILASVVLILIVLMQRASTSGGLGTAFGGGFTESTFGAEAGDMLRKITYYTSTLFFVVSLLLYLGYIAQSGAKSEHEGAMPTDFEEKSIDTSAESDSMPAESALTEAMDAAPSIEEMQDAAAAQADQAGEVVEDTMESLPAAEATESAAEEVPATPEQSPPAP